MIKEYVRIVNDSVVWRGSLKEPLFIDNAVIREAENLTIETRESLGIYPVVKDVAVNEWETESEDGAFDAGRKEFVYPLIVEPLPDYKKRLIDQLDIEVNEARQMLLPKGYIILIEYQLAVALAKEYLLDTSVEEVPSAVEDTAYDLGMTNAAAAQWMVNREQSYNEFLLGSRTIRIRQAKDIEVTPTHELAKQAYDFAIGVLNTLTADAIAAQTAQPQGRS